MTTKRFSSSLEVIEVNSDEYIVRTSYDFVHVRGASHHEIMTLVEAVDSNHTNDEIEAAFPAAQRPELRDLVLRLRRTRDNDRPATPRVMGAAGMEVPEPRTIARRLLVVGNGSLARALRDRVRGVTGCETVLLRVAFSENVLDGAFRDRARRSVVIPFLGGASSQPSGVRRLGEQSIEQATPDSLAEIMKAFDLVLCAFDDEPYRAFMIAGDGAERAGVPTLFVTSGLGNSTVGPLCIPGVTPGFRDAYRALFHQAAPELADLGFVELLRSHPTDDLQAEAVARYVAEQVELLLGPSSDSILFGHMIEVMRDGSFSRLAPVLRTTTEPAAAAATREKWPELHDAAVLRLAVTDSACTSHRSDRQIPSAQSEIKRVLILGGGTAGFLTALTLRKRLPHLKVALLESSKVPIIGVGEATTPALPALLHGVLGIDIVDFFRTVQPTFKLGIKFDWGGRTRDHYFNYPFGAHGQLLEAKCHQGHILDYSLQSMLMSANKLPIFRTREGTYESRLHSGKISFAYHIDNKRFVECLHREARRAGVEHIDATVKEVLRDESGELVKTLVTDDGRRLEYDFYVDCSGFPSLLLEKTLGSEWIPFSSTLFTDRAVTGNVPNGGVLKPYTVAETMDHGWCWNISTPQEDHRGYVFSSAFCTEEQAVAEMRAKNPGIGGHKLVKFRSGRHREFWKGNVVAIGNAYAFVEPLESTGIHMIIESILAFIGSFPQSTRDEANRRDLNRYIGSYWDELRWFLGIHFHFNTKLDTPFWKACRAESNISGFEDSLATFQEGAPLSYRNHRLEFDRLWGDHGRDVLLMGQDVPAKHLPPRETKEQWMHRVELARAAVRLAVPQHEGLALLRANPEVLYHLVTNEQAWPSQVTSVFKRETSSYFEVRTGRQGRMDKPRDTSRDQNVLLPKGAA